VTTPVDPPPNRASLVTPPGRGAVAVIVAEGPGALAVVDSRFQPANRRRLGEQPINRVIFGHWSDEPRNAPSDAAACRRREEVVVCRTTKDQVEVHCHGGVAAADRILAALADAGCRVDSWPQWTARHAACPLEAEAAVALAAAATRRTAAILLDQQHGALRRAVEAILVEVAAGDLRTLDAAQRHLAQLLEHEDLGLHLTRPWQVAIAGRPNVGKSSLVNALIGYQRAIVFDQPGTTRDVLAAETAVDGWPVCLTDSAGLHRTADPLEAAGVQLARRRATSGSPKPTPRTPSRRWSSSTNRTSRAPIWRPAP
jgi:tRNA modification GTPase